MVYKTDLFMELMSDSGGKTMYLFNSALKEKIRVL